MKKILLIALSFVAIAILAVVVFALPTRFRLQSTSPSGELHVIGLRFQGQSPHTLDGTLRLVVSHEQTDIKQQTSIPWGRDLAIKWDNTGPGDSFVVTKNGHALVEFQVLGPNLRCVKGNEYLTADPYAQKPQN